MARRANLSRFTPKKSLEQIIAEQNAKSDAKFEQLMQQNMQNQQIFQGQMGQGAVPVGGTDSYGVRYETPVGQFFDAQKAARNKAATDASVAIASLSKMIPILNEFEGDFAKAFPSASKEKGIPGRISSGKKVFNASILQNDPELAAALNSLEGKRTLIARGLGEVGNLAEQEQKVAMQNLPVLKFQGPMEGFLPEAPAVGESKIRRFRDFINAQIQRNLNITQSGGDLSFLQGAATSPIPGSPGYQPQYSQAAQGASVAQPPQTQGQDFSQERQQAILAIQKGASESKVRERFRQRTGQDL